MSAQQNHAVQNFSVLASFIQRKAFEIHLSQYSSFFIILKYYINLCSTICLFIRYWKSSLWWLWVTLLWMPTRRFCADLNFFTWEKECISGAIEMTPCVWLLFHLFVHERTATIYIYIYLCSRASIYSYTDLEDPFSNSLLSLLIPMGPFLSPSARNPAAFPWHFIGLLLGSQGRAWREKREREKGKTKQEFFYAVVHTGPFSWFFDSPQKRGDLFWPILWLGLPLAQNQKEKGGK